MTPRSLVGMTMGARKRAWLAGRIDTIVFPDGINTDELEMKSAYSWPEIRRWWQPFGWQLLGQRLRPCPGCQECGVRRFTKPEGFFSDNTHYVEIRDNAKVRLWRLKHTPILWQSKCGPRSVPTTFYDLEYCVGMVERFEWIELTQPNLCDGSGVLPARAKKVRR